ncbi:MAG TPA: nitronate monooxygenase [Chloroflexota bacterium]|nr:nitronate monooxygenase [Chloroflexota bacterium]
MLRTRLCDLLGVTYPIINAPMAGPAKAELAAAVAEAGGLGLIGGSSGDPDWLRQQIGAVRARTNRPFGVGFISSQPGLGALLEVAIAERVPVIAHSFADPTPYVGAAHAAGILVLAQVQSVDQAVRAARAGVDAITAQGVEAGGHTGTSSATLPLVPAVIDAVGDVPVIAAGGIADGRGLAAVLMLGAEGAWIGTRFAASREAAGSEWGKARIVRAGTDDTVLTQVYDVISGAAFPAGIADRVLQNTYTRTWHGREQELLLEREAWRRRLEAAAENGDAAYAAVRAGNAAGLVGAIEPAGDILRRIVAEAVAVLRTRTRQVLDHGAQREGTR